MRHATKESLGRLGALLEELRALPGLAEKSPGVFYLKSKAFLHFHEDGERVFADVRLEPPEFDRRPVTTPAQQAALLAAVRRKLAGAPAPRR